MKHIIKANIKVYAELGNTLNQKGNYYIAENQNQYIDQNSALYTGNDGDTSIVYMTIDYKPIGYVPIYWAYKQYVKII